MLLNKELFHYYRHNVNIIKEYKEIKMKQEIKNVLESISGLSNEEKVQLGCESVARFLQGLVKGGIKKEDAPNCLIALTKLFVSADQSCNGDEYSYFRAVTGLNLTPDQFFELTNGGRDPEFMKACFEFLNILNSDDRIAAIIYGCCLLSCDDNVNLKELDLLNQII